MISPHHQQQLDASAISPAIAVQRGYESLEGLPGQVVLRQHGFGPKVYQNLPGLLIPLWGVDGKPCTWVTPRGDILPLAHYRPDHPLIDAEGKSKKYELPYGAHMVLDIPPSCVPALGDPTIPLWITEGEKKADALASQGKCALALLGVTAYRGRNTKGGLTALADWESVALNGRTVHVVFDSDVVEKMPVQQALQRLQRFLERRQALVQILMLPLHDQTGKTGIDDYLATGQPLEDLQHQTTDIFARNPTRWEALPLQCRKDGQPLETLANYALLLSKHSSWKDRATFDTFSGQLFWDGHRVTESLLTQLAIQVSLHTGIAQRSIAPFRAAMEAVAHDHRFDALQQWIAALPMWDSTKRVATYLQEWLGAEDSPYIAWAGRMLLFSLLDRALSPGALVRYVVILEGSEGIGKSAFLRWLGAPWAITMSGTMDSKEAQMLVQGAWLVELGELGALSRTTEERIKSFLSDSQDSYVQKWEKYRGDHPRRCVFVGTVNPGQAYLRGQGGLEDTRFVPVIVTKEWQQERDEEERLQLFAEALVWYNGLEEPWWSVPLPVRASWTEQREIHQAEPIYQEAIETWCDQNILPEYFTVPQVIKKILDIPEAQWISRPLQMEVARALKSLGFEKGNRKREGKTRIVPWYKV